MKSLCFVTSGYSLAPCGGYKMIYEYANRLSERGYEVAILDLNTTRMKSHNIPEFIRRPMTNVLTAVSPRWFKLNKKIKLISAYSITFKRAIEKYDVCIATDIYTVKSTLDLIKNSKKAYFIQGYEIWDKSEEYVQNSYQTGMTNIVVSNWLKNIVDRYSNTPSILVRNPIDLDSYRIINDPMNRKKHTIGLLYHEKEIKGLKYSLEVIRILKGLYSDLEVYTFGTSRCPMDLPDYFHYTQSATQIETIEIYNTVSVWLCATIDEGFGLTGLEAMACGCVLVSTDYSGVHEYADNNVNALLSPVKDVGGLVDNVRCVFDNDKLKLDLIANAQESVKAFSWDKAVDKLEIILNEL